MTSNIKLPFYKILFGAIISHFPTNSKVKTIPLEVNSYILLYEIISDKINGYTTGVYTKENRKYIIKTWKGEIKDLNYFNLVNEYQTNYLLEHKIENIKEYITLRIPKVIEVIRLQNSLSIVYEYIHGRKINNEEEKVEVFTEILKNLKFISQIFSKSELRMLSYRPSWFYVLSFPLFTLLYILKQPSSYKLAISSFIKSILYFFPLKNPTLTFAHRDVHYKNIILHDQYIYLLDFENFVVTLPFYDLAYILVESTSESFSQKIISKTGLTPNLALIRFIAMHQTFGANYTKTQHYKKCLEIYYEK